MPGPWAASDTLPPMLPIKFVALPVLMTLAFACDAGKAEKAAGDVKAAKADQEKAEKEDRIEAIKLKRLAEAKAEADALNATAAAVDKVCVLPEQLPKKLDKACDAVAAAHDAFMLKHYADNPKTIESWKSGKGTQLPMTIAQCIKAGSIEVAACQVHAFETAGVELKKEIPAFFRTCIGKFSKPAEPAEPAEPAPKE